MNLFGKRKSAFTADDVHDGVALAAHIGVALASAQEVGNLEKALGGRTVIGQATGILTRTSSSASSPSRSCRPGPYRSHRTATEPRPERGDLVCYNPLGIPTIIYSETSSAPTLTKMGETTPGMTAFETLPNNVNMRIEAR